jgi:hypothetical protein
MKMIHYQFLALFAIIGLGFVLYVFTINAQRAWLVTFHIGTDETSHFIGKVISNNNSNCTNTGVSCTLNIQVGLDVVHVIYDTKTINSRCTNRTAAAIGTKARTGDMVEVDGFYQKPNGQIPKNTVTTCLLDKFYIKILPAQ